MICCHAFCLIKSSSSPLDLTTARLHLTLNKLTFITCHYLVLALSAAWAQLLYCPSFQPTKATATASPLSPISSIMQRSTTQNYFLYYLLFPFAYNVKAVAAVRSRVESSSISSVTPQGNWPIRAAVESQPAFVLRTLVSQWSQTEEDLYGKCLRSFCDHCRTFHEIIFHLYISYMLSK